MHAPSEAGVLADPTQEDESLEESSTTVQMDTAKGWAELGVDPRLVAALETKGIKTAFEIQALTVADALAGHDVCGKAKTGSGKTLAFSVPVLQRTLEALTPKDGGKPRHIPGSPARPRALMLVPTRELALQVHDVVAPLAELLGLRVIPVYGGTDIDRQIRKMQKGVEIIIATPGRLIDLGERGVVDVSQLETLVLDEADRMADMGFMPQVEWVLRRLDDAHQTLLFSATLDGAVDRLVKRHMNEPVFHEVASDGDTVDKMEHRFFQVHQMDKVAMVASIAKANEKTLVFVRTKRGADRLVEQLIRDGVKAGAIHGDLRQNQRERTIKDFGSGRLPVLVATDVAARGIHIDAVDVVVHFDPPEDHKAYLHRSGRTARAGTSGVVVSLLLWNQVGEAEQLQKKIGLALPIVEMFSNNPAIQDLAAFEPSWDDAVLKPLVAKTATAKTRPGARPGAGRRPGPKGAPRRGRR
jgi:superfamily II DNA/RNA helicase